MSSNGFVAKLDAHSVVRVCGLVVWILLASFAVPSVARAQFDHSDVDFGLDENKIVTDKTVYDAAFPTFGIARQFTSNPGFAAESDGLGTLGGPAELFYNVLEGLQLWDGQQFVTPRSDVRIRISNNPPQSASTLVDAESGMQLGYAAPPVNRIGAASQSGEVHSHVNFFLEPNGTGDDPPSGAYGIKLSLGTDNAEIIESDPFYMVFNFGLSPSDFDLSLAAYESALESVGLPGDFDGNGTLDAADIDALSEMIRDGSPELAYDVTGDGAVDTTDRDFWVESLKSTYFGDSNLDGEFSSADIVAVFQIGEYEDQVPSNSTWAEGDWNGDGDFTSGDIVTAFQRGGYEQGPRSATAAVPEPCGGALLLLGALLLRTRGRGDSN